MSGNTEAVIQQLRQAVYNDPELQARLFALTDIDDFIATVCKLAHASGHKLEYKELRQAMFAGRKAWVGRQRQ